MAHLTREITELIEKDFFKGKVIVLTGARQVGKTTLIESVIADNTSVYRLNADDPADRDRLENQSFTKLDQLFRDSRFVFIDEAQKVANIGTTLKLLVDHYKDRKQIIATGSSSINLLSHTQEPLTGRKFVYELFSFSIREMFPDLDPLEIEKALPNLLIFGSYPEIFLSSVEEKRRLLQEITSSYLYQDILELEQVRNPAVIQKLLSAIALQIGSEVSLSKLAALVGLDVKTVERYIDLLEKNYVLFRLPPYHTNQRKTLSKLNKIYFYDLGVRNALIQNFNPLDLRSDVGFLWENFIIAERMKLREYHRIYKNQFFWRTYDGAEIDLVEEGQGELWGYEIKWGEKGTKPKSWFEYPGAKYKFINRENLLSFVNTKS